MLGSVGLLRGNAVGRRLPPRRRRWRPRPHNRPAFPEFRGNQGRRQVKEISVTIRAAPATEACSWTNSNEHCCGLRCESQGDTYARTSGQQHSQRPQRSRTGTPRRRDRRRGDGSDAWIGSMPAITPNATGSGSARSVQSSSWAEAAAVADAPQAPACRRVPRSPLQHDRRRAEPGPQRPAA
jgi:hypothetical protein